MAKIPTFDPLTTEARSPLIAGITEALNKISAILEMRTSTLSDSPLTEVYISADDRYRIYQAPIGSKIWLMSPHPVIKKNGEVITESSNNFSIDYLGGSIAFSEGFTLTESDTLTVSCTYIVEGSSFLDGIESSISSALESIEQYKGYYSSYNELSTSVTSANPGDFAVVGGTENNFYLWNSTTGKWEGVFKETDLSNYYDKSDTDNLLGQKEPTIAKHGDTSESDNYYYGGRKTWVDILSKIRNAQLTGLSTETGDTISETDSIVSAMGKLQKQITDSIPPILGTGAPTTSTSGVIGQEYINQSNGDKYHLVSIQDGNYNWQRHPYVSLEFTVTLSSSGWAENSQTVSNDYFLSDGYCYFVIPSKENEIDYVTSGVEPEDVTSNGSMTFICSEVPDTELTVTIVRLEVQ